jgi:hypothetical protein
VTQGHRGSSGFWDNLQQQQPGAASRGHSTASVVFSFLPRICQGSLVPPTMGEGADCEGLMWVCLAVCWGRGGGDILNGSEQSSGVDGRGWGRAGHRETASWLSSLLKLPYPLGQAGRWACGLEYRQNLSGCTSEAMGHPLDSRTWGGSALRNSQTQRDPVHVSATCHLLSAYAAHPTGWQWALDLGWVGFLEDGHPLLM